MPEKQIVLVLEAVQAGVDTVARIAQVQGITRSSIGFWLLSLEQCGVIQREKIETHRRGRPSFRYSLAKSATSTAQPRSIGGTHAR